SLRNHRGYLSTTRRQPHLARWGRGSRRSSPPWFELSSRAKLESLPNARALVALDLVAKNIVPQAPVGSAPGNDSRPGPTVEEGPAASTSFCPRDPPGHEARK